MFANPDCLLQPGSAGSNQFIPRMAFWSGNISCSLTSGIVREGVTSPWQQITESFGSLVRSYFRKLTVTASAHTIFSSVVFPDVTNSFVAIDDAIDIPVAMKMPEKQATTKVSQVLANIERLTGLKKTRVAEDLFNVTRQAYNAWERGMGMSQPNLSRVLDMQDVLIRASKLHSDPASLQIWLQTPRGANAEKPIDLLKSGEFGKARLLALLTTPSRPEPIADWILKSRPDPWTAAQMRSRSRRSSEDASSTRFTDINEDGSIDNGRR